jgi:hypothetical protein
MHMRHGLTRRRAHVEAVEMKSFGEQVFKPGVKNNTACLAMTTGK